MPEVASYDNEKDWMAACVPTRIDEGNEQEQAVAACLNIWREAHKSLDDALVNDAKLFAGLTATEDMREGLGAFLEKRRPIFKDK